MKIVFIGNMNNMPFYFAKEFKKKGFDVTFIVDAEKNYLLDRPESWDKELENNYPDWVIEKILKWNLKAFKFSFPKLYFKKMIQYLNHFDIIFLNGHWISLGGFLKKGKHVINIFAGFDLDVAADFNQVGYFDKYFKQSGSWFKKIIPSFLTNIIFNRMIGFQRKGIRRADVVNYFPTGVNSDSDKLLNEIKAGQVFKRLELRGFDCDKFPYQEPITENKKFTILNVTRFFYLNNRNDNKRNDIMIKGIGRFLKINKLDVDDVEILFFEKGDDIDAAKKLCDEYSLTPFIRWKKQVSVEELNYFFAVCDVTFDQLGVQWVAAGLFSMLTGRPLIANGRPEIFEKLTNEKSPICQATSEEEVEMWLTKLYVNRSLIKEIGVTSREYVLKYYNLTNSMNYFIESFSSVR